MEFFEKDLEEIIFTADKNKLANRGLDLTEGKLFRQKRIGKYGVADLIHAYFDYEEINDNFYVKSVLHINVIELKKDKIGISAFLQALGYLKGIQRYFEEKKVDYMVEYNITLIGKSIDTSGSFPYLTDIFDSVSFYVYKYNFDGIYFYRESEWKLIDEGF